MREVARVDRITSKEAEVVLQRVSCNASLPPARLGRAARNTPARAWQEPSGRSLPAHIVDCLARSECRPGHRAWKPLENSDPHQVARPCRRNNPQNHRPACVTASTRQGGRHPGCSAGEPSDGCRVNALRSGTRYRRRLSGKLLHDEPETPSALPQAATTCGGSGDCRYLQRNGPAITRRGAGRSRGSEHWACRFLRQLMFVFEDILKIDDAGMKRANGANRPQSPSLCVERHQ